MHCLEFPPAVTHLVVAVEELSELLADPEVRLLAGLLREALQLVDVAVAAVLEGEPGVRVEVAEAPGLVHAAEHALHQRVAEPERRGNITGNKLALLWGEAQFQLC